MAFYEMTCTACGAVFGVLRDLPPREGEIACRCGSAAARHAVGPSSQVVERLDNGAMPRAVERLADAERLYEERARTADSLAGTANRTVGT